jgi:hypothetical protein
MKKLIMFLIAAFIAATSAWAQTSDYFNGFESSLTPGWDAFNITFHPTRVASPSNGITSAAGSWHAEVNPGNGPSGTPLGNAATNFGGYNSVFPSFGYNTSIDVYLNVDGGWANDTRLDIMSAISKTDGAHLGDFCFNIGFYNDATGPGASTNRFIISASNNAGRANSYPKNPGRNPIAIAATGWYTFVHDFYNDGNNILAVDLKIYDSDDNLINSWTESNSSHIIGNPVGGNRYGWVGNSEFSLLAIDNSGLTLTPAPPVVVKDGTTLAVKSGHATIQDAINASTTAAGDVIEIQVASHTEGPQIIINKNLTLKGLGKTATTLYAAGNTGSSGDARGWILVNAGVEFNMMDLTLDGNGKNIMQGVRSHGTGTIDEVAFNDIKHPGYNGIAVVSFNNLTIQNSDFTQIGRVGISFFGTGCTNGQANGNTYTGKGPGDWIDYAVELGGGAFATITDYYIIDNIGVALSDGSTSAGVLVTTYYGAGTAG